MMQDIRICFVGDSFVNGTGDETSLGWVGRLCAAVARQGHPVTCYNLGVRRNTSRDILQRWERECAARLPEGCDHRVVFSLGVNDTAIEDGNQRVPVDESIANIRQLLGATKRYKTLFVGPPPIADNEHNLRISALSAGYQREAAAFGVPFIDVFSTLTNDEEYKSEVAASDGAHPRSSGYKKMAAIIGRSPDWWWPHR